MSSSETIKERVVDEHGNIRTDEQANMNGADVFNFVIREIPRDVKRILKYANKEKESFDYFIFNQANKFMNSYLSKKLKLPKEKVPFTIHKYGNTSSVSIPLTIASELRGKTDGEKEVFLSGFGVGLSWANAVLKLVDVYIPEIVEI